MLKNVSREALLSASDPELQTLCAEIRREILTTVSGNGGHLASNLGVVEMTVALHRAFDFPRDKIVFDVGHQCYAHKMLSGRASRFGSLRKKGGLSGFPKRSESEYDCYGTGHAGTAISAALGIAKARDLKGEDHAVIAFVGDGSFNNGLIYEALNSLEILKTRILIVLNDNGMSISPTVGGMHELLSDSEESATGAEDAKIALFGRFGLQYAGVCSGNDLQECAEALDRAKKMLERGSVILHVRTKKGLGYAFSENAPELTHGVAPDGARKTTEYSRVLGEELCAIAENDERIVAVTAAMTDSLGLRPFFERFPERAFDVGICEEHACVLAASLAAEGMKPYYAIYSTFLQRAFDEILHDVCGQNLPVTFCIDRAGITGADGETHQGVYDLSYLSPIPNLVIAIPADLCEFRAMLRLSAANDVPFAIRYPRESRGETLKSTENSAKTALEIGKFGILHSNMSDIVMLAAGERSLRLAENVYRRAKENGMAFTLVNARFLKPLDEELLSSLPQKYIVTVEDNALIGGLGDAVARFYRRKSRSDLEAEQTDPGWTDEGHAGSALRDASENGLSGAKGRAKNIPNADENASDDKAANNAPNVAQISQTHFLSPAHTLPRGEKEGVSAGEKQVFSFAYPDRFIPQGEVGELMRECGLDEEEILRLIGRLYARR